MICIIAKTKLVNTIKNSIEKRFSNIEKKKKYKNKHLKKNLTSSSSASTCFIFLLL